MKPPSLTLLVLSLLLQLFDLFPWQVRTTAARRATQTLQPKRKCHAKPRFRPVLRSAPLFDQTGEQNQIFSGTMLSVAGSRGSESKPEGLGLKGEASSVWSERTKFGRRVQL